MRISRVRDYPRRARQIPSTKESPLILRVVSVMNLFGLIPKVGAFSAKVGRQKWINKFSRRTLVTWIIVHYYTLQVIASSVIYAIEKKDLGETLCNAAIAARCVVNSIVLNLFLNKSDQVFHCFNEILSFDRVAKLYEHFGAKETVSSCVKCSPRTSKMMVAIGVAFLIAFVTLCGLYAATLDRINYISLYVYNLDFLKYDVQPEIGRLFCFLEMISSLYVILVSFCLQIFLLVTVATLSLKLNRYREFCSNYFVSTKYAEIAQCHTDLYVLVRQLEVVVAYPFVLWIGEWMANVAFNAPSLVTEGFSDNIFDSAYWYCDVMIPLIMSFIVSLALSSLYSIHGDLIYAAHRVVCGKTRHLDIYYQRVGTFMIIKMYSAKIQITIFRCFAVNKTLILSLYAAISTYILFMTQEVQTQNSLKIPQNGTVHAKPEII